MNNKIVYAAALTTAIITGYSIYNAHNKMELTGVLLANVEALSTPEETNIPKCPDAYDVPNHYLEVKTERMNVECTTKGSITIGNNILRGDYQKGKNYCVALCTYNCSGEEPGACCKSSDVRVEYK